MNASDRATKTYTVGEIMRLFDVDAGDAWDLVLSNGWDCYQPLPDTKWQITIPEDKLPVRNAETPT